MIAIDTNILVYAHRRDSAFHAAAAACVAELAEGRRSWTIPWPCAHEFLAIVTHPRIYDPPTPLPQATAQLTAWASSPTNTLLGESPDHLDNLSTILLASAATGPRIHDARIAAICVGAGVTELWTADRDFSRFPIATRNPLSLN